MRIVYNPVTIDNPEFDAQSHKNAGSKEFNSDISIVTRKKVTYDNKTI